jgi:hypothetical protein
MEFLSHFSTLAGTWHQRHSDWGTFGLGNSRVRTYPCNVAANDKYLASYCRPEDECFLVTLVEQAAGGPSKRFPLCIVYHLAGPVAPDYSRIGTIGPDQQRIGSQSSFGSRCFFHNYTASFPVRVQLLNVGNGTIKMYVQSSFPVNSIFGFQLVHHFGTQFSPIDQPN